MNKNTLIGKVNRIFQPRNISKKIKPDFLGYIKY